MKGWSVNLSSLDPDHTAEVELPVEPLWVGQFGPVVEVVFWSEAVSRWMHGVAAHFHRELPPGHIQVTVGDLAWIRHVTARAGSEGLKACLHDLESCMVPSAE